MKKKKNKIFLKILLGVIVVLLFFLIIVFLVDRIKSNTEYKELSKAGYINKYSAGEYDLNIYRIGNEIEKLQRKKSELTSELFKINNGYYDNMKDKVFVAPFYMFGASFKFVGFSCANNLRS